MDHPTYVAVTAPDLKMMTIQSNTSLSLKMIVHFIIHIRSITIHQVKLKTLHVIDAFKPTDSLPHQKQTMLTRKGYLKAV